MVSHAVESACSICAGKGRDWPTGESGVQCQDSRIRVPRCCSFLVPAVISVALGNPSVGVKYLIENLSARSGEFIGL